MQNQSTYNDLYVDMQTHHIVHYLPWNKGQK